MLGGGSGEGGADADDDDADDDDEQWDAIVDRFVQFRPLPDMEGSGASGAGLGVAVECGPRFHGVSLIWSSALVPLFCVRGLH